jgi:hypothetical protein
VEAIGVVVVDVVGVVVSTMVKSSVFFSFFFGLGLYTAYSSITKGLNGCAVDVYMRVGEKRKKNLKN